MNITAGRITVDLFSAGYKTNTGAGNTRHDPAFRFNGVYTDGTGALQWNKHYSRVHSLSALEVLSLDLSTGLTDPFGDTFGFSEVKAIVVYNLGTVGKSIGGEAGFAGPLPAGAVWLWAAVDATGKAITSGNTLEITNGSDACSVRVIICGD